MVASLCRQSRSLQVDQKNMGANENTRALLMGASLRSSFSTYRYILLTFFSPQKLGAAGWKRGDDIYEENIAFKINHKVYMVRLQ